MSQTTFSKNSLFATVRSRTHTFDNPSERPSSRRVTRIETDETDHRTKQDVTMDPVVVVVPVFPAPAVAFRPHVGDARILRIRRTVTCNVPTPSVSCYCISTATTTAPMDWRRRSESLWRRMSSVLPRDTISTTATMAIVHHHHHLHYHAIASF